MGVFMNFKNWFNRTFRRQYIKSEEVIKLRKSKIKVRRRSYNFKRGFRMKITILCIIVFFLGFGAMGYMHEQVHIAIYNNYDIESHIEYFSHFPDLVTISTSGARQTPSLKTRS